MLAIDLCAGIGWSVACSELGISELGIEIMPEAIATRDAMGAYTQDISISDLPDTFCAQAPLQIAGPPCQTFSMAGGGAGRRALAEVLRRVQVFADTGVLVRGGSGDPRTWLVLEPLRLAIHGMPMFVVWEQVPPVLPVWEACAVVFRSFGYSAWVGILNAEQHGVPQTRKRAILIARRDGKPATPPVPSHSRYHNRTPGKLDPGVLPWVSMAEALGWAGATMRSNYGTGGDSTLRGERTSEQPAPTLTSKIGRNKWTYRSSTMPNAAVRHQDQPAPTIAFGNDSASAGWHYRSGNQAKSIRVTVEEAAILQTFPCPELIQGKSGKRYLQVGNMVPPLLGKAILSTFLETK